MSLVSQTYSSRDLVVSVTFRRSPMSWSALDKNLMPGHLFECNPVYKVATQRGTDTPVHRLENPESSVYCSTSVLSPHEQLERKAAFQSSTQDESCLSSPNSAGTLRSESEMERKPVVPASTQDEALFHCTEPSGVPRGPSPHHSYPDFAEAPGLTRKEHQSSRHHFISAHSPLLISTDTWRPVCLGTFWFASRVPSTVSNFKTERGTSLETL